MPRSVPTPVTPTFQGALINPTAPDALGDILPVGDVTLVVICGATGTTVSIPTTATVDTLDVADGGGTVAPNTSKAFGPFPSRLFVQPANAPVGAGKVLADYSSVATVTRYLIGS